MTMPLWEAVKSSGKCAICPFSCHFPSEISAAYPKIRKFNASAAGRRATEQAKSNRHGV
jgi:hypothetical protein